jgi:NAD(P)-dependent dehydrogenase (short-subunit alcohol dehydrogenase family)
MDVFRREMEVNYFGAISMVKSFMPLLRRYGRGSRCVITSSMIGLLPQFPGLAGQSVTTSICYSIVFTLVFISDIGYASSKHALECFTNTLRCEAMLWGTKVINICPGMTKTPFLDGAHKQMQVSDDWWSLLPLLYSSNWFGDE